MLLKDKSRSLVSFESKRQTPFESWSQAQSVRLSTFQVVITVDDVNDHAPRFPQPVTQISFSEGSTPGSRVLLDSAEDRDQGDYGRVRDYTSCQATRRAGSS